jgi:hypothetical protein
MPDNSSIGAIEDFLIPLAKSPELFPHVDQFIEGLPLESRQVLPLTKARAHAYLAVQERPGRRLGEAIKFGYFDPRGPVVDRFVNWLRQTLDC